MPTTLPPLSDAIITAISRMLDDAGATREPSHSELDFQIQRAALTSADPKSNGQVVGKAKRVRAVLSWSLDNNLPAGRALVANLLECVRGCGGFREGSPNFVGSHSIEDVRGRFRSEGFDLSSDGEVRPLVLDTLTGAALTEALASYVRRAIKGADDAALIAGTGKDLLEATAAHVLTEVFGSYSVHSNFPTLLGQTFVALGLATSHDAVIQGEHPRRAFQRALFDAACSVNRLRNKEGTGHGRPWLPTVTAPEARRAIELMGLVADLLLECLATRT